MVSQTLIDLEIIHEECKAIINEEEKYGRLKENIKMIKSEESDVKKNELMEQGKGTETNRNMR